MAFDLDKVRQIAERVAGSIAAELADLVFHRVFGVALEAGVERSAHHEGAVGDRGSARGG